MTNMEYHFATDDDLDLLAEWNHQLIRDEGHRNRMSVAELRARMEQWLAAEYKAVVFSADGRPVAYAVYRENEHEVYLRQLFIARDVRRQGIGRAAVGILRDQIWPRTKRLAVEVLTANQAGVSFWRAVGYSDYSLALEIMPGEAG
jgi:predicted acetyltransferase